jgi:hypothetical protein
MSEHTMQLKNILNYIEYRLDFISQVSLEKDEYNTLYNSLKKAQDGIIASIRAQVDIDKKEKENADEKM